jgi:hypothetical protein
MADGDNSGNVWDNIQNISFDLGNYNSATVSYSGDQNMSKGDSDRAGDGGGYEAVVRSGTDMRNNYFVGVRTSLDTSPTVGHTDGLSTSQFQRDTARITVTGGVATQIGDVDVEASVSGGQANGWAADALYDLKNVIHGALGYGDARRSPTTASGPFIGVSGRVDYDAASFEIGPLRAELVTSGVAQLGTDHSQVTGAVAVRIGEQSDYTYHPNLPGSVAQDNFGTGIGAGFMLTRDFNNLNLENQNGRDYNYRAFAEGNLQITDSFRLNAIGTFGESDQRFGQDAPTVGTFRIGATFNF